MIKWLGVGIKVVFALAAAALYLNATRRMLNGAINTVGYTPNTYTEWFVSLTGTALITFVAGQIGVTVATTGNGIRSRIAMRSYNKTTGLTTTEKWAVGATIAVLVVDLVVLAWVGWKFADLAFSPEKIIVKAGDPKLKDAPDYITIQAKAIASLVIAGAGGVTVAALK